MMGRLREKLNQIAEIPAKIFLGGFTGKEEIEFEEFSENVRTFKAQKILGIKLFNGKILLNEKLFDEGKEKARRSVFLHEIGHRRQKFLKHLTGHAQLILSPPGLALGFLAIGFLLLPGLKETLAFQPGLNEQKLLFYIFSFYLLAALVSYTGEIKAELYVFRKLGEDNYLEARDQTDELTGKKGMLEKIAIYPSHPPEWFSTRIIRKLDSLSSKDLKEFLIVSIR